jgi:predicted nucleic acid-binding protein
VAQQRGGTAVTDDRAARATCRELGLPVTGTIGILVACIRDRMLDAGAADEILMSMTEAGFHSPVTSISGLL